MLYKYFFILLLTIFYLSCSDDPTSPEDEETTGTLTDIDGNVYKTIKIGDQWLMAENLRVTHYRNGEAIPNVIDAGIWSGLTTGAYCNYGNDIWLGAIYGRLYNWYTINDNRNIAPAGWHVPSDEEWAELIDYLGGSSIAGGKMKTTGALTTGNGLWVPPNTGATNESGFSVLPGGYCYNTALFTTMGSTAAFWSSTVSTQYDGESAMYRGLFWDASYVGDSFYSKKWGMSIRCVRD